MTPHDTGSEIYKADDDAPPALVYCRVSTRRLAEGTSLVSQRDACAAHAERLGYRVARVTEEVYTGADLFSRPQLARDRADIRAGAFKAVIAYSVDRLTRNPAHLTLISDECDRAGCRLVFVTSHGADSSSRQAEAYAAEIERAKITERMTRGRRTKLRRGRPVFNGWDLYGYRADRERGVYIIHEPEAGVVRRIFSMCAGGKGMHSTAAALNREGVPSPKADRRPGARWTSSAISDLLNCRSYKGEEYGDKTKLVGGLHRPRPESEWIRLPDGVRPPIVTAELWGECQQSIHARAERMNNKERRTPLLRGHIFCAECGAAMIRNYFKRGKYEYEKYRCGSRWRPFKTECTGEGVSLAPVEEWVWNEVGLTLSDAAAVERLTMTAEREAAAPQLLLDLGSARRQLLAAERALAASLSTFGALESDPPLREYAGRNVEQTFRERRQLGEMAAELEARFNEGRRRADGVRRVLTLARERGGVESFTFEERRLALALLHVKVRANGDDPAGWWFEILSGAAVSCP